MRWAPLSLLLLVPWQNCFSQSDACAGAASLLTRVKEQLTPSTPKDQLGILYEDIKTATRLCKYPTEKIQMSELYYYRTLLADQMHDAKDVAYVRTEVVRKSLPVFTPGYSNPLAPPPAAAVSINESRSQVAHKWALVVGINQFESPSAPALSFAAKDANDFATYLTDPKGGNFVKDRVRTLTNDQATLEGFRIALGWLRANVQPEDLVVIYISSHGSPSDYDPNKVSYIIMHDTKLGDSAQLYGTSLQMIDLVHQINSEIKARRAILFLDTCFSGDASGAGRVESAGGSKRIGLETPPAASATNNFSNAFESLTMGVGRAVITASRSNEESFEDKKLHHGYFTYYLISALRSGGGKQTLAEVFPKVRDQVIASVASDHPGKTQTPSCEFSDRASTIVLTVPDADSKVAKAGAPSGE